jgi:hypothetical protein
MEVGTELSPEVASALPVLAGEVVRQVERWRTAGGAAKEISATEQLREHI